MEALKLLQPFTKKLLSIRRKKVDRNKILYKGYTKKHCFTRFITMQNFGDDIKNGIIRIHMRNIKKIN